MRSAVGFLIALWGLSQFFSSSIQSMDSAMSETFKAAEAAAIASQESWESQ